MPFRRNTKSRRADRTIGHGWLGWLGMDGVRFARTARPDGEHSANEDDRAFVTLSGLGEIAIRGHQREFLGDGNAKM